MLDDFKKLARQSYAKNHRTKMLNFEKEAIIKTLKECNYNIAETARWLGYTRQYTYRKMKTLGIKIIEEENKIVGKRKRIENLKGFSFSAEERAVLNDLLNVWLLACSDKYDNCNNCPRKPERCMFISDSLIDKIYNKTGKK